MMILLRKNTLITFVMIKKIFISLFVSGTLLSMCTSTVFAQDVQSDPVTNDDPQTAPSSYVYDLKNLIKRSRKNIDRVNDKIKEQAVYKRNLKREEKAREYYQKGAELEAEGRLDVAREYYEKAVRITEHPEMRDYIRESERRFKLQAAAIREEQQEQYRRDHEERQIQLEEAQRVYDEAVSLYRQQKYHEAKESFEYVETLVPDYKATRSYMKIVEQDIFEADAVAAKMQKEELDRQKNELAQARQREKELWRKELERKEHEREERLQKKAEEVYEQALDLYREEKYLLSKEKFQEVEWVVPNYKGTRGYLSKLERLIEEKQEQLAQQREEELEKQRWEEELAKKREAIERQKRLEQKEQEQLARKKEEANFVYNGAVKLYKEGAFAEALVEFEEVEKIMHDFRSTRKYMERIQGKMSERDVVVKEEADQQRESWEQEQEKRQEIVKEQRQKEEQRQMEEAKLKKEELRALYKKAVSHFRDREYTDALTVFEQLAAIDPDYRATQKYIARIGKKIGDDKVVNIEEKMNQPENNDAHVELREEVYAATADEPGPSGHEVDIAMTISKGAKPETSTVSSDVMTKATVAKTKDLAKKEAYQQRLMEEKEREQLKDIAQQATAIFAQIKSLTEDIDQADLDSSFKEVENVFANLVEEQERLMDAVETKKDREERERKEKMAREARERERDLERQRRQQKEEHDNKIESLYRRAVKAYQQYRYEEAKQLFAETNKLEKGYKDVEQYWKDIDFMIAKQKLLVAEFEDKAAIEALSNEAAVINSEIIDLTNKRDFDAIKDRFTQLQLLLQNVKDLKEKLLTRREAWKIQQEIRDQHLNRNKTREAKYDAIRRQQKQQARAATIKDYPDIEALQAARHDDSKDSNKIVSKQEKEEERRIQRRLKQEELVHQQQEQQASADALFEEAVALFNKGDYYEAKGLFREFMVLSNEDYKARNYLRKIAEYEEKRTDEYGYYQRIYEQDWYSKRDQSDRLRQKQEKIAFEQELKQRSEERSADLLEEKREVERLTRKQKSREIEEEKRLNKEYLTAKKHRQELAVQRMSRQDKIEEIDKMRRQRNSYDKQRARFDDRDRQERYSEQRDYLRSVEQAKETIKQQKLNPYVDQIKKKSKHDYEMKKKALANLEEQTEVERLRERAFEQKKINKKLLLKQERLKRELEDKNRAEKLEMKKQERVEEKIRIQEAQKQHEEEATRLAEEKKRVEEEKRRLEEERLRAEEKEKERARKENMHEKMAKTIKESQKVNKPISMREVPVMKNPDEEDSEDSASNYKQKRVVPLDPEEETVKSIYQRMYDQRRKSFKDERRSDSQMRGRIEDEIKERKRLQQKLEESWTAEMQSEAQKRRQMIEKAEQEEIAEQARAEAIKKHVIESDKPVVTTSTVLPEAVLEQKQLTYLEKSEQIKLQAEEKRRELARQQQALREQFRDGVEFMYNEALRLHKEGEYDLAVDKFEEVNRLMPGYKKSERYIDRIQKKLNQKRQRHYSPHLQDDNHQRTTQNRGSTTGSFMAGQYSSTILADESSVSNEPRAEVVDDILDLFDPNVQ